MSNVCVRYKRRKTKKLLKLPLEVAVLYLRTKNPEEQLKSKSDIIS